MKYVLVVSMFNGDVHYFGPFNTKTRAQTWAEDHTKKDTRVARWHVATMSDPERC